MQQVSLHSQRIALDVRLPIHLANVEIEGLPIFRGHERVQLVRVVVRPLCVCVCVCVCVSE